MVAGSDDKSLPVSLLDKTLSWAGLELWLIPDKVTNQR
jgi:hypothetical protein